MKDQGIKVAIAAAAAVVFALFLYFYGMYGRGEALPFQNKDLPDEVRKGIDQDIGPGAVYPTEDWSPVIYLRFDRTFECAAEDDDVPYSVKINGCIIKHIPARKDQERLGWRPIDLPDQILSFSFKLDRKFERPRKIIYHIGYKKTD